VPSDPDATSLTEDRIITGGGWNATYARVVAIAVDDDVAFALIDGNGDGVELEMEYWFKGGSGWSAGQSSGYGSLQGLPTVAWDAGPMVCAVGRAEPGETILVEHKEVVHGCRPNEYGIWTFIQKVRTPDDGGVPRVLGEVEPADEGVVQESIDRLNRMRQGTVRYAASAGPAEDEYNPSVPWNCSLAEEGRPAHVRLSPDYWAELPLWGDWPRDTPLPEDLRRRLAAWQEEFENGYSHTSGWTDAAAREHWLAQADGLADALRELLNGRATLDVDLWPHGTAHDAP